MPRYDPLPSNISAVAAVPSSGISPQNTTAPHPQRYQQLTMEPGSGAQQLPRQTHPGSHPRSHFACGACFNSIESYLSSLAGNMTINRKVVTGYMAGFLVRSSLVYILIF